jgi:DNA-directed RNA polymerase subunit E'/Rpb7
MVLIIQKKIFLDPKYLDSNITHHLLNVIKNSTKDKCTKEYGYILSIKRLVDIIDNEDNVFTVKFEAETLKPEASKKYSGVVCKVYKDGLFIDIAGKQKIMVPAMSLTDWVYKEDRSSFVKENKYINEGSNVDVTVTAAQYNKNSFSCFGSLV